MVHLQQVSKSYGGQTVVDDVSLSVDGGQTLVLIGPSGSGKSTVLRMLAGLVVPTSGRIEVDGRALTADSRAEIRGRLGYVIQDGGLFPHLTARQNITVAARVQRWPQSRTEQRVSELATLTQFPTDGLDRYPAQLSGGQRQRVGIMRALLTDPDVLLLDEPLAALDPMIRRELQQDLKQIFRSLGKTVILVTHDLHEAAWFADRIVLLHEGRIAQQGSAAELSGQPATPFVSAFVQAQQPADWGNA